MFAFVLLALAFLFPVGATIANDPAPGLGQSKEESRNLECKRVSEQEARNRYPGVVPEAAPRGDYMETDAMACKRRMIELGERRGLDDAILSQLTSLTTDIAESATALTPELGGKTWRVEAFYPDARVQAKIAFATKNALVERGARVSDRGLALAAGDVEVLGRMAPRDAYPIACSRYFAEGSLTSDEVLLGVVLRDSRETILHAGVCVGGQWRWLR